MTGSWAESRASIEPPVLGFVGTEVVVECHLRSDDQVIRAKVHRQKVQHGSDARRRFDL